MGIEFCKGGKLVEAACYPLPLFIEPHTPTPGLPARHFRSANSGMEVPASTL